MKNTELQILEKVGLVKNGGYNYSEIANAFLSTGYTSSAGNTYLNSIRLAEGILIKESIGHGWYYTFLNGIKIYTIKDKVLVAEKHFHNHVYSKQNLRIEIEELLIKQIKEMADHQNVQISVSIVKQKIKSILDQAFNEDQRKMLQNQIKKLLE